MPNESEPGFNAARVRPTLQAIARLISTDRRIVVLATEKAEILLSNKPATQLELDVSALQTAFNWHTLCTRARRSGSVAVSVTFREKHLEGELVHLPLGNAAAFLLRLVETDQEAVLLQNRARAATLLRVSHDLKTPIQSVLASAEALFDSREDRAGKTNPDTARVEKSARMALTHIEKVIRVIRGEMTSADLQADEDFDLAEESRNVLDMIEPIVLARRATVTMKIEPETAIGLHGPVHIVRALLQNMFDNASKHGGETIDIRVACAPELTASKDGRKERLITVEVADQGGGLPATQKARLLGTGIDGTRDERTTGANADRTTAGLSVLAHAIGHLGGHIEVFDRLGGGAPLKNGTQPVIGTILRAIFSLPPTETDALPETRETQPPGVAAGLLQGIGVLVVEDSPSSRDWLVQCLRNAGARVDGVENGFKALEVLNQPEAVHQIDVLLTDITLPNMSGVELMRRIKTERSKKTMAWNGQILGLTAHTDAGLEKTCLALGMSRLLEKPIRTAALCRAVQNAARGKADTRQTAAVRLKHRPARTAATPDQPLARKVVAELIGQLGEKAALGFMIRAHAEAKAVMDKITSDGQCPDTKRLLHSATGSSGLTGLALLQSSLRQVELALDGPVAKLNALVAEANQALSATERAISLIGSEAGGGR
ncbi:response regulator [Sulfitobacter sp. PR48]|uniref:ATP-binding response regulator n=1 Tax=Sulfitobacter sp. PR48 TaxID=3028383 RepID=UPI00237B849B|nr:response regulator [Sulfitobacter sp. PR48]MDD9720288.1 response regulator [Sulfitobacter sp. PR48]